MAMTEMNAPTVTVTATEVVSRTASRRDIACGGVVMCGGWPMAVKVTSSWPPASPWRPDWERGWLSRFAVINWDLRDQLAGKGRLLGPDSSGACANWAAYSRA